METQAHRIALSSVSTTSPVRSEALDAMWRDLLQRQTELARAREVFRGRHPRVRR